MKCLNSLPIKCSTVDNRQYLSYKNGKKDFICQYCTDYSCLKCDKHVYDRQPGILCNICNLWVHRSCAGISKKEYEDLQNSDNDEPWYCRPCKINLFPFFELTNNQLIKLHENNKTKSINKDYNTFCNSQKISIVCSVCDKRNNRADTSVFCRNCNSVVHKKCSRLKQAELLELKRDRVSFLWECSTCMKDKFPFHSVDNMDIVSGSFNSNFSCKCQKTTNFVLGSEKYIFNYKVDSEKTDKPYSSHIDYSDMMADSFILQCKFKFYQIYEFHKLVNNLSENKAFSVFHTNICSLQANFDNL